MNNKNKRGLIIFDLDGTLYELPGGSYKKSPLQRRVLGNAQKYISVRLSKSRVEAGQILNNIQKQYGEQISIGLENEYGLPRYDYFSIVWDIPTRGIVKKTNNVRKVLEVLRKTYDVALVSDAPQVWIKNVLKALSVQDIFFGRIFSGEGNRRKGFSNAFSSIIKTFNVSPSDCVVVGDQEETDIVPAKRLGASTVFIHPTKRSLIADVNIKSIRELLAVINTFYLRSTK